MKKMIKALSLVLVVTLIFSHANSSLQVSAANSNLSDYITALDELNQELGSNYAFPTDEQLQKQNKSYEDMVSYYSTMTIEEFKDYIRDIHYNGAAEVASTSANATPRGYQHIQKYINGANAEYGLENYFEVNSTIYYADGANRYSTINSYRSVNYFFPCYELLSAEYDISSDCKTVNFTFWCGKYLNEYLTDLTMYRIDAQFRAGELYGYQNIVI